MVLLATTLKRFTDDDGFTLACTTIMSRSRSRYLESLCVLCFVVEKERSDDVMKEVLSLIHISEPTRPY